MRRRDETEVRRKGGVDRGLGTFEETPGRGGTDGRRPVYIPDNIDSAGYFEKQIVPGTLKRHFPMSDKDLVDYCEYYLFEGVFIASGRSYKTFVYEGDHTARIMGPILKCSSLVTRDVLVRACIALIWSFDILERIDIPRDRMPIETGLLINWLDAQVGDLAIGSSLEDLKATVRKLADGAGSGVRSGEE